MPPVNRMLGDTGLLELPALVLGSVGSLEATLRNCSQETAILLGSGQPVIHFRIPASALLVLLGT